MITINGILIQELREKHAAPKKPDPLVKHYDECMEFLKSLKFPVRLKFTKDKIHKNAEGRVEYSQGAHIRFDESFQLLDGPSAEIRYYRRKSKDKKNNDVFDPPGLDFNKPVQKFDNKRLEELYFLIFVSPHCELMNNDMMKLQNLNRRRAHFFYDDAEYAAKMQGKIAKLRQNVITIIYDTSLGLDNEKIRTLAKIYQVPAVDAVSDAQVRLMLEQFILSKQITYTPHKFEAYINKFIEDSGATDILTSKVLIANLKAKKLIYIKDNQGTYSWMLKGNNKTDDSELCKVVDISNADESLMDYLTKNKEAVPEIEKLIK